MVKYYNSMVVFEEVPNEITLAINITNCPCRCPGCHSKFLWPDVGTELTSEELERLIKINDGITCVCFMGGDADQKYINSLAKHLRLTTKLKAAWYSGMDEISPDINLENFNYIKVGRYDEKFGGLNNENTNQKFFRINNLILEDITKMFLKKRTVK